MSDYKPHLIANMQTGLVSGLEPWLLPQDALTELTNGYLRRGVVRQRLGYTEWRRMVHAVDDEVVGSLQVDTGTLANFPIQPGSLTFDDDGGQTIVDDGDGTLSGDGSGTINYTTGAYSFAFDAAVGNVTADYAYYSTSPVVGLHVFRKSNGTEEYVVCDTERANTYDTTTGLLVDLGTTDVWAGDATDRVHAAGWQDVLYLVNNSDQIMSYDGSTFAAFDIDIDGGGNDVDTCLLIFAHKERLILLRPTESGTPQPQRARWCTAQTPADWTNDGYVDAPTLDYIMAAEFLNDDLVVFFSKSTWRLKYTADSDLPFRWERVEDKRGSIATESVQGFADEIIVLDAAHLMVCDGRDVTPMDQKYPDLALDIDRSEFEYVNSYQVPALDQMLLSYPPVGATQNTETLVFNYAEKTWAKYDYGFNAFGSYEVTNDPTWDGTEETWDEIEWSWDDVTMHGGHPVVMAGDTAGKIYTLNTGGSDDGSDIALTIYSSRWNPYIKYGKQAQLGWVDFLVDRNADLIFTLAFFSDQRTRPYLSHTVTCDSPSDTEGKIWKRVPSGMEANFHRIKISHSANSETLVIHAIMPWFRAGGMMTQY